MVRHWPIKAEVVEPLVESVGDHVVFGVARQCPAGEKEVELAWAGIPAERKVRQPEVDERQSGGLERLLPTNQGLAH